MTLVLFAEGIEHIGAHIGHRIGRGMQVNSTAMPGRRAGKTPALKDINGVCPGFLWWIWADTPGRQRLRGVKVPDSVIMINGTAFLLVFKCSQ